MKFKILNIGNLKYDRIKSMLVIKTIISYYTLREIKDLLDSLLSGNLTEFEDENIYMVVCRLFDNVEIEKIFDYNQTEVNFPCNFIPPTG